MSLESCWELGRHNAVEKYVRRKYRSLRESLQQVGALRVRNRVGNEEERRIRDLNHNASRRLIDWAQQFESPVLKIEDLDGIRDGSDWRGVHSWHFRQLHPTTGGSLHLRRDIEDPRTNGNGDAVLTWTVARCISRTVTRYGNALNDADPVFVCGRVPVTPVTDADVAIQRRKFERLVLGAFENTIGWVKRLECWVIHCGTRRLCAASLQGERNSLRRYTHITRSEMESDHLRRLWLRAQRL